MLLVRNLVRVVSTPVVVLPEEKRLGAAAVTSEQAAH